jgi:hypothetical protein
VGFLEAVGAVAHAVGKGIEKVGKAIGDGVEEILNGGADAAEEAAEAAGNWATDNLPEPLATIVGVAVAVFVAGVEIARGVGGALAEGIRIFAKIVGYVVGLDWVTDWFSWAFGVNKIVDSADGYDAPSTPRTSADGMTVAVVSDAWGFSDSGPRRFFRINDGRVESHDASVPGDDWSILAPPGETNPRAISYHSKRLGETVAPAFDMVAANSGRVFAKEKDKCRFYFAMLEPMFRRNPNEPVRSAYFKLDPEQGQSDATDADRLVHLSGEGSSHPAAIRFPVFRMLMSVPLVDMMAVNIDRNLRVWHLIDARPPSGGADPPGGDFFPSTKEVVTYESNGPFGKRTKYGRAYHVRRVLDIGVGHEQWHEHDSTIYGGEMDSLDGPGLPEVLPERNAYRFFNGPVNDKGGFIDGTINYYTLCQFVRDEEIDDSAAPPPGAFGILWLDEQAALSERWRLLHPWDSKFSGFADIVPSAIVQYLDRDATYDTLRFDQSKFWCPFRAGNINRFSRMAVSRQVVVTSGFDRQAGRAEYYSIHFGFGACDRTWRWRLPPDLSVAPEAMASFVAQPVAPLSVAVGTTGPGGPFGDVPVEPLAAAPFGLREDMTLHVRQRIGDREWVWFQKYLPADQGMRPDSDPLRLPQERISRAAAAIAAAASRDNTDKPATGFDHPWQFVRADVFHEMHARFGHFGVYERQVNSRSQYYRLDVGKDEELLRAAPSDAVWADLDHQLFINQPALDWAELNPLLEDGSLATIGGAIGTDILTAIGLLASGELTRGGLRDLVRNLEGTRFVKLRYDHGLFNECFVFRLIYREPLGWLMIHYDKRDDDLLGFSNPNPPGKDGFELRLHRALGPRNLVAIPNQSVPLFVRGRQEVLSPPRISRAEIRVRRNAEGQPVQVDFRFLFVSCARTEFDIEENIWRIRVGALPREGSGPFGEPILLFERTRHGNFLPEPGDTGWHSYTWSLTSETASLVAKVGLYFSEQGRITHGTSMWFEDVVGHVGTPDALVFLEG